MSKMDAFRRAFTELGDRPAEELSVYIEQTYQVKIDPRHIPVFRATLLDWEKRNRPPL